MSDIKIAIYIRLSKADDDTGHGKDESNSVVNQRSLIHRYLDNHPELSKYPRTEFVDDGYTGTNTNRPAYQKMIEGIREGKYKVAISKDFSRLHRDYLELGNVVEYLFPFLQVRYISINDGYDSKNYDGTTGGLDVVMRAIIYDAYSKDLSMKTRTGNLQSRKKGRRSGSPCFGYTFDPKRKAMDIIEPESAAVVRRIFDAVLSGKSIPDIALELNRDGIPTPGMHHQKLYPKSNRYKGMSDQITWNYGMIHAIVRNYKYAGAAVGGKRLQVTPLKKNTVAVPVEEQVIVPNMHEAIVSEEEFNRAQEFIRKGQGYRKQNKKSYPLQSLVRCGNCGRSLTRRKGKGIFVCIYGKTQDESECDSVRSMPEEELNSIVFQSIQDFMGLADKKRKASRKYDSGRKSEIQTNVRTIAVMQAEIEKLRKDKLKLYEKYCADKLSREDYLRNKSSIDEKITGLDGEISDAHEKIAHLEDLSPEIGSELESHLAAFRDAEELTYDLAHAFIDQILINTDGSMEIRWRFKDIFTE